MVVSPRTPQAAGDGADASVSIVSTVLNSICFTEWVDYHIALGVSHFYLYFDSEDDANREVAARYGRDVVSVRDCQAPGRPITAKQCANVRHAVAVAHERGCRGWLLHIDDDELLHLSENVSLSQLTSSAPRDAHDLHFRNYEVCKTVPELEGYDFFSQERYFYTKLRRSYKNGKSAGCLRWAGKGLGPNGAHYFKLPGQAAEAGGREEMDDGDGEGGLFMQPKPKDPSGLARVNRDAACILHFPFIVYSRWRSKCSRDDLSEWKVNWGFYRKMKDVITDCSGGEDALRQEFIQRCFVGQEAVEKKMSQGDLIHVPNVGSLIERGRRMRSSQV
eukprot:TRINITY_DN4597_c4_g1_i1.p1 TRINITY_DN4597_c4_g1~~TRINITY_DN4597_c4_g1_i1.p1  ORF type:complete len:357 (+),score=79.71 TRINITY_DN4597_c4_g1_i1:74-1072(+)